MGQLGLVPSNYLLELSQYLTQDVGAKNGTPEAPNSNGTSRQASNGWVISWFSFCLGQNHDLIIPRNNVPTNEEVRGKPWYYGPISRGDCDNLMAERGQDGDFLVRDSESNVSRIIGLHLAWINLTWDLLRNRWQGLFSYKLTNLNISL